MADLGFWATSRAEPERVVVIEDDGTRHRAGEILASVNRQTHALRALGIAPGDAVAVCLGNRLEFLELYMAVVQAGGYFVPIPCGSAPPEIAHMLADSAAKVFLFDTDVAAAASAALDLQQTVPLHFLVDRTEHAGGWRSVFARFPASAPGSPIAGDKLIYTSGTTGLPRAVRRPLSGLTLEQVGKVAAVHLNAVARIRPRSGAVHLVSSPLHHSASLLWCVDHMHLGHTVSLMKKWSPETMLDRIERDRVTGSLLVPTHFHRLLRLPRAERERRDLSTLRHVVHTGAECPVPIKKRMLEWWGPVIYEVYGATEGGGTRVGPDEWLERPGTVGRSFGRIQILRDDGTPCDAGEPGAVFIKFGPQRFEYNRDKVKTESAHRENHFTVGDIGYLDEDGYLFLCGRGTDVIISGGVNMYPAQIESVLASHPAVSDVGVIGVPDAEWGEQVKAVIELKPDRSADEGLAEELKALCRSQLARLKCPRTIEFVERLPRNENGKLLRRQLREAFRAATDGHRGARNAEVAVA